MEVVSRASARPRRLPRPLAVFALIAFGAPWIGWGVFRALHLQSPWRQPSPLAWALWLSGSGVSLAGIVATYVAGGGGAVLALLRRGVDFSPPLRWWAFALLLPFAWELPARIVALVHSGQPLAINPGAFLLMVSPIALLHIITGPLGEEFGWRGFLLPELLKRIAPLPASLTVGLIWSLWHVPLYVGLVITGATDWVVFVTETTVLSVLFYVLMVRTGWALSLAILFHWAVNVTPGVAQVLLPGKLGRGDELLQSGTVGVIVTGLALLLFTTLRPQPTPSSRSSVPR